MSTNPQAGRRSRLLTVSAGLGVAVLAGATYVLTYDDLRTLAIEGGAARRWAPAYPIMVDALITVTIGSLVVAWRARWWSRWIRWVLLLALLGGTGAASVQRALHGYGSLPDEPLRAGVAGAPHAMLVIAVWLWLSMFRLARRPAAEPPPAEEPGDLIPGLPEREPEPRVPAPREPAEDDSTTTPPTPYSIVPDLYDAPATRPDHEEPRRPGRTDTDGDDEPRAAGRTGTDWDDVLGLSPDPSATRWDDLPGTDEPAKPARAAGGAGGAGGSGGSGGSKSEDDEGWRPLTGQDAWLDPAEPTAPEEPPIPERRADLARDPRPVPPASLPTDVELVRRPQRGRGSTTQPDMVLPTLSDPALDGSDPDGAAVDRAEDPDGGDDSTPPSSKFRSSPTPPRD
ncbi:hypothetical protein DPM19_30585 [Actinomadura craniellae]|uniref:DUF2637 domain-containing protein n=1 Tax=Actinomadura craniellae TaxID=2231787 RepID=A0A365GX23_9ACTN|nr:DUF2637 domain-containing protein [Actinomadura craniellae]RAY11374.1 hypothetical protein DPM19_30585 [Actinomadura craniellae]